MWHRARLVTLLATAGLLQILLHAFSLSKTNSVRHASYLAARAAHNVTESRVVFTQDLYVAGYSHPHPEICPSLGAKLRLLILVTSAPSHSRKRDGVRLTWGHYAARRDVALAFVLGTPLASMEPAVEAEDALYGDLIVGNSADSYSNLTLKTISILEWVDTYCPRVPRLLKTDDDMFINVPKLLKFIDASKNATKTIWGNVLRRNMPRRNPKSKYYLPVVEYPFMKFPEHATGAAYLVTTDCVGPLLRSAGAEPYLRFEDVFVTGVIADLLGLRREHVTEFYNTVMPRQPCVIPKGLAIHNVRYHEQFNMWSKLLDGRTKCPE